MSLLGGCEDSSKEQCEATALVQLRAAVKDGKSRSEKASEEFATNMTEDTQGGSLKVQHQSKRGKCNTNHCYNCFLHPDSKWQDKEGNHLKGLLAFDGMPHLPDQHVFEPSPGWLQDYFMARTPTRKTWTPVVRGDIDCNRKQSLSNPKVTYYEYAHDRTDYEMGKKDLCVEKDLPVEKPPKAWVVCLRNANNGGWLAGDRKKHENACKSCNCIKVTLEGLRELVEKQAQLARDKQAVDTEVATLSKQLQQKKVDAANAMRALSRARYSLEGVTDPRPADEAKQHPLHNPARTRNGLPAKMTFAESPHTGPWSGASPQGMG